MFQSRSSHAGVGVVSQIYFDVADQHSIKFLGFFTFKLLGSFVEYEVYSVKEFNDFFFGSAGWGKEKVDNFLISFVETPNMIIYDSLHFY